MTKPPHRYKVVLIAFAVLLAVSLYISFERSIAWLNGWTYTHWLFSYDAGILKRGLVGETLQQIGFHPGYHRVYGLAKWNLYLIFGLTAVLLLRPLRRNPLRTGWILFSLVLISSSSILQHAADSVARLNNVALLLMLVFVLAIPVLDRFSGALFLALASAASVATHEASFFLVVPFMVAAYFFVHRHQPYSLALGLSGGAAAVATLAWILINSGQSNLTEKAYYELLITAYSRVNFPAVKILFTDHEENLRMTMAHFFTWSSVLHHTVFLTVASPILLLLWRCIRDIYPQHSESTAGDRQALLLLGASALAPLALYPVGFDHFRWLSASITVTFFGLALLCSEPKFYNIVTHRFRTDWPWVVGAIAVGWAAGPSADFYSFDWARTWFGLPS